MIRARGPNHSALPASPSWGRARDFRRIARRETLFQLPVQLLIQFSSLALFSGLDFSCHDKSLLSRRASKPAYLFSATALMRGLVNGFAAARVVIARQAPFFTAGLIGGFGYPGASRRCGARPVHERICRHPKLRGECSETRLNMIALMYALKTRSQGGCGLLPHRHTAANSIQASIISRRQTRTGGSAPGFDKRKQAARPGATSDSWG